MSAPPKRPGFPTFGASAKTHAHAPKPSTKVYTRQVSRNTNQTNFAQQDLNILNFFTGREFRTLDDKKGLNRELLSKLITVIETRIRKIQQKSSETIFEPFEQKILRRWLKQINNQNDPRPPYRIFYNIVTRSDIEENESLLIDFITEKIKKDMNKGVEISPGVNMPSFKYNLNASAANAFKKALSDFSKSSKEFAKMKFDIVKRSDGTYVFTAFLNGAPSDIKSPLGLTTSDELPGILYKLLTVCESIYKPEITQPGLIPYYKVRLAASHKVIYNSKGEPMLVPYTRGQFGKQTIGNNISGRLGSFRVDSDKPGTSLLRDRIAYMKNVMESDQDTDYKRNATIRETFGIIEDLRGFRFHIVISTATEAINHSPTIGAVTNMPPFIFNRFSADMASNSDGKCLLHAIALQYGRYTNSPKHAKGTTCFDKPDMDKCGYKTILKRLFQKDSTESNYLCPGCGPCYKETPCQLRKTYRLMYDIIKEHPELISVEPTPQVHERLSEVEKELNVRIYICTVDFITSNLSTTQDELKPKHTLFKVMRNNPATPLHMIQNEEPSPSDFIFVIYKDVSNLIDMNTLKLLETPILNKPLIHHAGLYPANMITTIESLGRRKIVKCDKCFATVSDKKRLATHKCTANITSTAITSQAISQTSMQSNESATKKAKTDIPEGQILFSIDAKVNGAKFKRDVIIGTHDFETKSEDPKSEQASYQNNSETGEVEESKMTPYRYLVPFSHKISLGWVQGQRPELVAESITPKQESFIRTFLKFRSYRNQDEKLHKTITLLLQDNYAILGDDIDLKYVFKTIPSKDKTKLYYSCGSTKVLAFFARYIENRMNEFNNTIFRNTKGETDCFDRSVKQLNQFAEEFITFMGTFNIPYKEEEYRKKYSELLEQDKLLKRAPTCQCCIEPIKQGEKPIVEHDHLTGRINFVRCCKSCNSKMVHTDITLYAHNASSFDNILIIERTIANKSIAEPSDANTYGSNEISTVSKSENKHTVVKIGRVRFCDSKCFVAGTLDDITSDHVKSIIVILNKELATLIENSEQGKQTIEYEMKMNTELSEADARKKARAGAYKYLLTKNIFKLMRNLLKDGYEDVVNIIRQKYILEFIPHTFKNHVEKSGCLESHKSCKLTDELLMKCQFGIKKLTFPYTALETDESYNITVKQLFDENNREKYWYDTLSNKIKPEEDIKKVQEYCSIMNFKTLGQLHDIYLCNDTSTLLDFMTYLETIFFDKYNISMLRCNSMPSAMYASLRRSIKSRGFFFANYDDSDYKSETPNLDRLKVYNLFHDSFFGGMSNIRTGISEAKILPSKFKIDMDKLGAVNITGDVNDERRILYIDLNAMYPMAMCKRLPLDHFRVHDPKKMDFSTQELRHKYIMDQSELYKNETVTKENPDNTQSTLTMVRINGHFTSLENNKYVVPMMIHKEVQESDMTEFQLNQYKKTHKGKFPKSKVMCMSLEPRINYAVDVLQLAWAIEHHSFVVDEILEIATCRCVDFLKKDMMDLNESRKNGKSETEKMCFKLMSNSSYGYFILKNEISRFQIVSNNVKNQREFMNCQDFSIKGSVITFVKKTATNINIPRYLSEFLLSLTKLEVYEMWNIIKAACPSTILLAQDTDSMILEYSPSDISNGYTDPFGVKRTPESISKMTYAEFAGKTNATANEKNKDGKYKYHTGIFLGPKAQGIVQQGWSDKAALISAENFKLDACFTGNAPIEERLSGCAKIDMQKFAMTINAPASKVYGIHDYDIMYKYTIQAGDADKDYEKELKFKGIKYDKIIQQDGSITLVCNQADLSRISSIAKSTQDKDYLGLVASYDPHIKCKGLNKGLISQLPYDAMERVVQGFAEEGKSINIDLCKIFKTVYHLKEGTANDPIMTSSLELVETHHNSKEIQKSELIVDGSGILAKNIYRIDTENNRKVYSKLSEKRAVANLDIKCKMYEGDYHHEIFGYSELEG